MFRVSHFVFAPFINLRFVWIGPPQIKDLTIQAISTIFQDKVTKFETRITLPIPSSSQTPCIVNADMGTLKSLMIHGHSPEEPFCWEVAPIILRLNLAALKERANYRLELEISPDDDYCLNAHFALEPV